jgi:hypothetical protein
MQRIFALLLVVVAVAGGIVWYVHWSQTRALNSGDVYVRDQPGDTAKPATPEPVTPQRSTPEITASAPSPTPQPAAPTAPVAASMPQPVAAPTQQPIAHQAAAAQPATPKASPAVVQKPRPTPPQEVAINHPAPTHVAPSRISPTRIASANVSPARHPAAIPASDTISRNPPNGQIFAASGRFELYRQGDITWRVDTQTGHACILFATDAQWSQARVFDHGCGAS